MSRFKNYVWMAVGFVVLAAVVSGITAGSAVAQAVKAALVRNIDTPALAPFRASGNSSFPFINSQQLLTTVPAGKRLVIEHVSYFFGGLAADQLVYMALRISQVGQVRHVLEIHPPHASASVGLNIQDGSQALKDYFEAGEEVWVSMSHITGNSSNISYSVTGYFVTP